MQRQQMPIIRWVIWNSAMQPQTTNMPEHDLLREQILS